MGVFLSLNSTQINDENNVAKKTKTGSYMGHLKKTFESEIGTYNLSSCQMI
jgi:hypothetical protein